MTRLMKLLLLAASTSKYLPERYKNDKTLLKAFLRNAKSQLNITSPTTLLQVSILLNHGAV